MKKREQEEKREKEEEGEKERQRERDSMRTLWKLCLFWSRFALRLAAKLRFRNETMTDKTNQVPTLSALVSFFCVSFSLWTVEDEGGSTDLSLLFPPQNLLIDNSIK